MQVEIFTDGACQGNPGPGGWGVVLYMAGECKTLSGSERYTTNNRMELMAVIEALRYLGARSEVRLTTDSQYVCKGMTEWIKDWKSRGWMTASGKPVKNRDLWQLLDQQVQQHEVRWFWVRGHSGHKENERADRLATRAIDALLQGR